MASGRRAQRMDRHTSQLGAQTGRRLYHRPFQTPRLEGAGGVHAPLQHQVGDLSDESKVASRNRERRPRAQRHQDRQLELKPTDPSKDGVNTKLTLRLVLEAALALEMADFEDAVQASSAHHAGLDALVTRNLRDFKHAPLPVYSVEQFL